MLTAPLQSWNNPTRAHRFEDEWLTKVLQHFPQVTPDVLEAFREKCVQYLSQALVQNHLVSEEPLGQTVEAVFHVGYVNHRSGQIDKNVFNLFNERLCRRYLFVPLRTIAGQIEIATANPMDRAMLADIEMACGMRPVPFFCIPERVECLIWQFYNPKGAMQDLLLRFDRHQAVEVVSTFEHVGPAPEGRAPVVQLLDAIIEKAVRMKASDIHIEHDETSSLVRYRIDGSLRNIRLLPQNVAKGSLVSRIKIMADLDITVHHRPQDGRAKIRVGADDIGLRVSTLPTKYGEKAVIRILDRRAAEVPFERLGFNPKLAARIEALLKLSQGLLLVTGPTGSGKTTSLYSMLNKVKSDRTNIVTIEDPIEYRLEGINQVQVNDRQGLGFANVLRSVLRQDPDVIMVGEIRDRETADVAFQAAMTGHFVFTTVHANDTISSFSRLVDMGVERYKIGPGLLAVTAQRLVRRLCSACKKPVTAADVDCGLVAFIKSQGFDTTEYFRPTGCRDCGFTGYSGRLALLEFLEVRQQLRDQISTGVDEAALRESAIRSGLLATLTQDALWHLTRGETSVAEIAPYI
ncbi:MAG: type II/IV secretion system protein, partial [Elusimicrobia bacterium]|nr:type II/IV secretion system protein [Elusimicrobiota bacterium]